MSAIIPEPSYVSGSSPQPLLYRTVGDTLALAARQWPEREALVVRHQSVCLTYRE
jgi:fatty-acyl-CoA synthase